MQFNRVFYQSVKSAKYPSSRNIPSVTILSPTRNFTPYNSKPNMSKLITVFGATGNQGGSVVNAVLNHPKLSSEYKIRGVTRDASKPAAQALAQKGVEVVQGDINDEEALRRIIGGSTAVFAVTNYWEKASKELEYKQGTSMADIAQEVGVEHFIWSSLPHVTKSESQIPVVLPIDPRRTLGLTQESQ
jgi:nucleoside-diphosphate-sugar epimerase